MHLLVVDAGLELLESSDEFLPGGDAGDSGKLLAEELSSGQKALLDYLADVVLTLYFLLAKDDVLLNGGYPPHQSLMVTAFLP